MWNIAIPAICVIAHLYLVVVFLPGFWREIEARGVRWHTLLNLFVVPLMVIGLIAYQVIGNFDSTPTWLAVVAFITIDALVVAMVLAAIGLRARRRRSI